MDERMARRRIEEYWNENAESFDEAHAKEDKAKWFEYFRDLLGSSAGQSVLDIGTGTGFLAIMAAELGFSVTAIDFAEQMLEIARKKTDDRNLKVNYLKADLNQMPFEEESFDYIVNSRVLWTLTDPDRALHEWKRVLKKGGQILSFVRLTGEMKVDTYAQIYGEDMDGQLKLHNNSGDDLVAKCLEAGFTKVDLVRLPDIAYDVDLYGEWYVLRAMKEHYEQEQAIGAISDFWNERSSTYEKDHELTSLEHWKRNLEQLVGADRFTKIIDVATGTGMIANLLGEMGYSNVTGMDISEGMMDIARQHAVEKNTDVSFCYGNALDLPLEDSSVDVLMSCRLLWTLLEPEKALAEWIRVVKPGGAVIALHEMDEAVDLEKDDQVWRYFLYGKNADPYMELNSATKSDYCRLFENSELEHVKLVHMEGCQTLENGKYNWYALVGYKKQI